MLKIVIVDDEKNVREALSEMLKLYLNNVESVESCGDISSAVRLINEKKIDVLLLDIEIGKENGFDIFNHFPKPYFKVIFITAYEQYAAKAFRFAAIDYLLKPVDPDLLVSAICKVYDAIDLETMSVKIDSLLHNFSGPAKGPKKLVLKTADNIYVVNPDEIIYCEADGSYTSFYLSDKSRILVTKTLGDYEELLEDSNFVRIHQTYLINLNHLKRFEKTEGGKAILKDGTSLPVASRKKDLLLHKIANL